MSKTMVERLKDITPSLSVGVLSANIMTLAADLATLEQCGIKLLHFDVMDGHFAPALTAGPVFVKGIKTTMFKDVHLMIDEPVNTIVQYAAAGADIITVHAEAGKYAHAALQSIGNQKNVNDASRGIARGIAINPGTPLCTINPLLEMADMVTLVTINPGFSGQVLSDGTAARAIAVREMIAKSGRDILLCIDGGITKDTIVNVAQMKPDIVVTGSALFDQREIEKNIGTMRSAFQM